MNFFNKRNESVFDEQTVRSLEERDEMIMRTLEILASSLGYEYQGETTETKPAKFVKIKKGRRNI